MGASLTCFIFVPQIHREMFGNYRNYNYYIAECEEMSKKRFMASFGVYI